MAGLGNSLVKSASAAYVRFPPSQLFYRIAEIDTKGSKASFSAIARINGDYLYVVNFAL